MATSILPVITDVGLAAAINANANGFQLEITHVVLSTNQFTPNGASSLSALNEIQTIASSVSLGGGAFRLNVLFPGLSVAPYNAYAIGFYVGDPLSGGILFAVYSHPTTVLVQRNSLDYLAQFSLKLSRVPAGSVTVVVDPSAAAALALVAAHETLTDPHPQYVRHLASGAELPFSDEGAIWHHGYNSLMTWQVFNANGANYAGYASIDIGLLRPDTQQLPRTGWVKSGVTGLPISMALYHWAKHNGLMLTTGWSAGTLFYKDNGNGTFVTPDVRGEHQRFWDDSRGVDSSRQFGSWQKGSILSGEDFSPGNTVNSPEYAGNHAAWGLDNPADSWVSGLSISVATRINGSDISSTGPNSTQYQIHAGVARSRNTAFPGVIKI